MARPTSSSMLASLIDGIGLDPTFLIGGIVRAYNSNAHSGKGEYYVVEPMRAISRSSISTRARCSSMNIEADHLDHYEDLDDLRSSAIS